MHLDEDFLHALETGRPWPTGGLGNGVVRLVLITAHTHPPGSALTFPSPSPMDYWSRVSWRRWWS